MMKLARRCAALTLPVWLETTTAAATMVKASTRLKARARNKKPAGTPRFSTSLIPTVNTANPIKLRRAGGPSTAVNLPRNSSPSEIGVASSASRVLRSFSPAKLSRAIMRLKEMGKKAAIVAPKSAAFPPASAGSFCSGARQVLHERGVGALRFPSPIAQPGRVPCLDLEQPVQRKEHGVHGLVKTHLEAGVSHQAALEFVAG